MTFKSLLLTAALAATITTTANAATYTYVGSWSVGDGPGWTTNPRVYTGQEAAAFLFGGTASNYAISTAGPSVGLINFRAHVDGWADTQYLFGANDAAQNFSLDTGGTGYNSNPGFGSSYSAYVQDHSSAGDPRTINYAFLISGSVPEPASWALMIVGFGLTGAAMRRRNAAVTA